MRHLTARLSRLRLVRALGVLSTLVLSAAAYSQTDARAYDRVAFSVTATQDVENDLLVAVLFVERQGERQSQLASEVNQEMGWAVTRARREAAVETQTLRYQTNAIYRNQSLAGWRIRQSVRLESRDAVALARLIGELQARLSIQSVRHELARDTRKQAEDDLIRRALGAFRRRAELIREELEAGGYRIVRLEVSTGAAAHVLRGARMMAAEAVAAPPALEPGDQQVSVTVNASIELQQ